MLDILSVNVGNSKAKLILIFLAYIKCFYVPGKCEFSIQEISRLTALSVKQTIKYLEYLINNNYIKISDCISVKKIPLNFNVQYQINC